MEVQLTPDQRHLSAKPSRAGAFNARKLLRRKHFPVGTARAAETGNTGSGWFERKHLLDTGEGRRVMTQGKQKQLAADVKPHALAR
jgi:hypothetical protein